MLARCGEGSRDRNRGQVTIVAAFSAALWELIRTRAHQQIGLYFYHLATEHLGQVSPLSSCPTGTIRFAYSPVSAFLAPFLHMYDIWHVSRSFKQTLVHIMLRFPEAEAPLLIILVQSTSRVHGKSMILPCQWWWCVGVRGSARLTNCTN